MAQETDSHIFIGIFLAILAAALGTTSKQLIAISTHLKKPWLFHLGASMNIAVGPIVDASAYAFAPHVIVAPFACLDVIFNALTAPYTLRWQNEVITKVHIAGTICVAIGAALTSVFADNVENNVYDVYEFEQQLLRKESIAYLIVELICILIVCWMLKQNLMSPRIRGISLGVIAGVLMGNVFFVKGLVSLVRHSISARDHQAWLRPTPYVCLACAAGGAIIGHMFMRKGLGEYKGVFMITIFEGAHITAACLSGCVVMAEMSGAIWWRYVSYWASVALIVAGILFINTAAHDSTMMGSEHHIAGAFVPDEEVMSFKDNMDTMNAMEVAPIGKVLDEQEEFLDMEFNDKQIQLDGSTKRTMSKRSTGSSDQPKDEPSPTA